MDSVKLLLKTYKDSVKIANDVLAQDSLIRRELGKKGKLEQLEQRKFRNRLSFMLGLVQIWQMELKNYKNNTKKIRKLLSEPGSRIRKTPGDSKPEKGGEKLHSD